MLGNAQGSNCLDVGGDNGVISYFLRKEGGTWMSVDMSEKAVSSIGKLVGADQAMLIEGSNLPFDDNTMDTVVIIDYLEHVERDDIFIQECHRVLKQHGTLITNVPHYKKGSLIRALQLALGLTDELHGHVRPGYTEKSLYAIQKDGFDILEVKYYSKFFVQLVDTGIQFAASFMGGKHVDDENDDPSKGVMIDADDFSKYQKAFKFYSLVYPFLYIASKLDLFLFWSKGHMMIVKSKSRPWKHRQEVKLGDGRSIAEATIATKIGTAAPF